MAKQSPISLQIPIIPEKLADLEHQLYHEGGNPQNPNSIFPFEKIDSVHFARFMIAPATTLTDGTKIAASLVYAANVDGTESEHLQKLTEVLPDAMDTIFSHCKGYPAPADRNQSSRLAFMKKYKLKTPAFYVGAPNRSVQQIKHESIMQKELQQFVKANKGKWSSSNEAYVEIKKFVQDPKFDWAREKYHLPRKNWFRLILLGLFLLWALPLVGLMILLIQIFYESRSKGFGIDINQVPIPHMEKMMGDEDKIYQNQLSQVFETKKGLRRIGLRFFLWQTNMLAKWLFVDGQLLNTPTIHFARWVLIDGGKRFVFFSNFDGSYDQYLGDFVDNSGWGLNTIYGAAVGYPKTLFVFFKGAYQIGEFMGWGRLTQVRTQTWYSAYPWDGLQQVVDRSKLRAALFNSGTLNEKQIKEMLRRI